MSSASREQGYRQPSSRCWMLEWLLVGLNNDIVLCGISIAYYLPCLLPRALFWGMMVQQRFDQKVVIVWGE